jgi:hypothetical protein
MYREKFSSVARNISTAIFPRAFREKSSNDSFSMFSFTGPWFISFTDNGTSW